MTGTTARVAADDTLPGHPDAVVRPTVVVVAGTVPRPAAMHALAGGRPLSPEQHAGEPAGVVEFAARECYDAHGRGRPHGEHVAHLLAEGHLSTFEHVSWSLGVRGVSRTLLAELTRHRFLSPSVRSQRYCDESACRFVVPPAYLAPARADLIPGWLAHCRAARAEYARLCREGAGGPGGTPGRKADREAARSVLPGCVETRLVLTANARAWREAVGKRLPAGADAEMRRLAAALLAALAAESPVLFAGLGGGAA